MDDWYARNNCTHAHCPEGCDKPQPSLGPDGELYCMRCKFKEGVVTRMVPCTPETCPEDFEQ